MTGYGDEEHREELAKEERRRERERGQRHSGHWTYQDDIEEQHRIINEQRDRERGDNS